MSDNGGPYADANGPLRGTKGQLYEGGIRVPFIAWWPGQSVPGRPSKEPVSTIDILPTALHLAGADPKRKGRFDGVSLSRVFGRGELDRDELFWVFPTLRGQCSAPRGSAVGPLRSSSTSATVTPSSTTCVRIPANRPTSRPPSRTGPAG